MARKALKFAKGGSSDRSQARYDRKIADIESDYQKAMRNKSGRAAEVAKAKYEQRMADARDDLAKWTGADRSKTRAAEAAAERNLSTTRRYGATKTPVAAEDTGPIAKPMSASDISAAVGVAKPEAKKPTPTRAKPTRRAAAPSSTSNTADNARNGTKFRGAEAPDFVRARGIRDYTSTPASGKKPAARTAPGFTPSADDKRAAELRAGTAADRKLENAPAGTPGAAAARLKKYLGVTRARENMANTVEQQAQRRRWQDVGAQGGAPAQLPRKQHYLKRASEERAAGREGNAKYFEREASYLKRGGKVKGYAKGGSVDGCAVRGKTKAKRK